jgi:hypothetical protein
MEGRYDWTFDQANNPLTASMYMKESGEEEIWYATVTWYYSRHEITTSLPSNKAEGKLRVWISDGELQVSDIPNGSRGQIFDMAGRRMASFTWTEGARINISSLPEGVYILKIGYTAVKFMK